MYHRSAVVCDETEDEKEKGIKIERCPGEMQGHLFGFTGAGKGKFMEQWVLLRKGADFASISKKFHISPRLAALIRNRDVVGDAAVDSYLNGTISGLFDGMLMKDMDLAVEILLEKIREQKKIRVIGDYDIDGVNATYILLEGLRRLGAEEADSDIPDRVKDGYGLNQNLIERAYADGVDTVVTCDNGIAAAEEIALAKRLGMTVIVTDHHEVPYEEEDGERRYLLPPADAVVDPKQPDCGYPFSGICGAAVAYKLIEALWEASGREAEDLDDLIENVAVATVGDVMDLAGENRIFVKEGLAMLKRTKNPGLKALIACTGIREERITAYHVGFILGPCLNAGGRLDTAKRALELLQAGDAREADILAGDLKALNDSRKEMTAKAVEEAVKIVERDLLPHDKVLVVFLPDCHESLAGIVAGKIREKYYRPVYVLTEAEEGIKGSGRSIEAYDMYEELTLCRDILEKYGGHKLATGVSMKRENLENFRRRLNENCTLTEEELTEKVVIDMELPFRCVTEEFIQELSLLEPFGKGNTKPVFAARNVEISGTRVIGKNRNAVKAKARDGSGEVLEALYFGEVSDFCKKLEQKGGRMDITYYPGINEYMGRKDIQVIITHYR